MKIYLVGGAVRDKFLRLKTQDQDWLVVGASIEQMLNQGFTQVGADFPVFLHPRTHQEYALARTERKSGQGYKGFICDFSPKVTLEEDLLRRDLTINAMAEDENGAIFDPYGGQKDIENKTLRHVSDAFIEDPLRVLRVARFAARFHSLGFRLADETFALLKKVSESGELQTLTPERVWKEWEKSLNTDAPEVFLTLLQQCGALKEILPEIDQLFGVPQPEKWHPEIDTGTHTLLVSNRVAKLSNDPVIRFAAQLHDLGKALTPKQSWPKHHNHEQLGKKPLLALCERLKVPSLYRDAALVVCTEHGNVHQSFELRAETFIKIFDRIDAWRKPERVNLLATACTADSQGRTGFENAPYPQANIFEQVFTIANNVAVKTIVESGFQGAQIRTELSRQRVEKAREYLNSVREKQELS